MPSITPVKTTQDLSDSQIARLKEIRHIALDLDGTIYEGSKLFPWSLPFLETLDLLNIGYTFLTNNSSKGIDDYIQKLVGLGIRASNENMYSSTLSTIAFLKANHSDINRLFVLGTKSMETDLQKAGYEVVDENPDAVLVGFDTEMPYQRLCKAAYWINQGLSYFATHPDRTCPTDEPTVLVDCGSVLMCLETAVGVKPTAVLGKPHPLMVEPILKKNNLKPNQLAVAGDRLYTDVKTAQQIGGVSILVLTGETSLEMAEEEEKPPEFVFPSLKELGMILNGIER